MKKVLWFDVETTGLSLEKNGIVQLAAIVEIDGVIKDKFEIKMRPFPEDLVEKEALRIHGFTHRQINDFEKSNVAQAKFLYFMDNYVEKFNSSDKFTPAGFNVRFDLDFLSAWFRKCKDFYLGSWINWQYLDPLPMLYYLKYNDAIPLNSFKLEKVCEFFEIEIKAHDALSDVQATRQVFEMTELLFLTYLQKSQEKNKKDEE